MAKTQTLREAGIDNLGVGINTAEKKLNNISLMGLESKNGYAYKREAVDKAKLLFEGKPVFANHRKGNDNHATEDYIGFISGVYMEGDRIKAKDFTVVNDKHWSLIESVASKQPRHLGFSPELMAKMDKKIVTEIIDVASVDLVTSPATTQGIFEETSPMEIAQLTLAVLTEQRPDLLAQVRGELEKQVKTVTEENTTLKAESKTLKEQLKKAETESKIRTKLEAAKKTASATQFKALTLLEESEWDAFIAELGESKKTNPPKSPIKGQTSGGNENSELSLSESNLQALFH